MKFINKKKKNGIENPDQLFKNDTETKERDIIYLKQKRWNPETGEAMTDNKNELNLAELENEKANFESQIASPLF